jgi:hypothetical protein
LHRWRLVIEGVFPATGESLPTLDESVAATCRQRCADLLAKHPLYPGIADSDGEDDR